MASGLLALKWNNHSSTFLHVLSSLRHKDSYCDATIACEGIFYPVHKIVLSTCSEYFDQIFKRTDCKHPVIVLKDVKPEDLEALLNYMYLGEVNVLQDRLSGLIKNAESLRIKGLAVPDEEPKSNSNLVREKRNLGSSDRSPHAKRRRQDTRDSEDSNDKTTSRLSRSESEVNSKDHKSDSRVSGADKTNFESECDDKESDKSNTGAAPRSQSNSHPTNDDSEPVIIKDEPSDLEEDVDDKNDLHDQLGFNTMDSGGGGDDDDDINYGSQSISGQAPSIDEVLGHAMPGPSGLQQSSSSWDGDGNGLSGGPLDSFNSDPSQNRQTVIYSWPEDDQNTATSYTNKWNVPNQPQQYYCRFCSKSFSSRYRTNRHEVTHTKIPHYFCHLCTFQTSYKHCLSRHLANQHHKAISQKSEVLHCSKEEIM